MNNEKTTPLEELLQSIGVTTEIRFFGHGRRSPEDKDNRDIYEVTIQNGRCLYRFNFGQSIVNSGKSKTNRRGAKAPGIMDIYYCLTKTNPGTFIDFCGEYGYDADSISAFKTYNSVAEEYHSLIKIFSHEDLSKISELLQDY